MVDDDDWRTHEDAPAIAAALARGEIVTQRLVRAVIYLDDDDPDEAEYLVRTCLPDGSYTAWEAYDG